MTLSKLFLIYWGICAVASFIYEWRELRKSNVSPKFFVGYLFSMTCMGFISIPFLLVDYFLTRSTQDWHNEE